MENVCINVIRQSDDKGFLYGSVRSKDIAEGLEGIGFKILRNQVHIINPIKTIGIHLVNIILHPELFVSIRVNVAQSLEEAEAQNPTNSDDENDGDLTNS